MIEMESNQERIFSQIDRAELFIDKRYLTQLSDCHVKAIDESEKNYGYIKLYRIHKIMFDEKEDIADKLIGVYNAVRNFGSSILLLLKGSTSSVDFFMGVRSKQDVAIASTVFHKGFTGNFPGSDLQEMAGISTAQQLLESAIPDISEKRMYVSCVSIVPSMRNEKQGEEFVQGLEKFIDTMRGEEYLCEIIAKPVNVESIALRRSGYEELYTMLCPLAKMTLTQGENEGRTVTNSLTDTVCDTINEGISRTTGRNKGYNRSKSSGFNVGASLLLSFGFNESTSEGVSSGRQDSKTTQTGAARMTGKATMESDSLTTGTMKNITVEQKNKKIEYLLERIDSHLHRLQMSNASGLWECAAYFIAGQIQTSVVAASTFKSLMLGEKTNIEHAYLNLLYTKNMRDAQYISEYLRYGEHPVFIIKGDRLENEQDVTPTTYVTGEELPLFIGVPRKSVTGVTVSQMAEFGRNIYTIDGQTDGNIPLGKVFHMNAVEDTTVHLDLESLTSHCFITGTTGSGKSNTVFGLLEHMLDNAIPFLVIEPAKGEYRHEFGGVPGINIFSTNPSIAQFLKMNPFKFCDEIHILEHLDRLIEVFNACWEMYAAMPAILKDAMEAMYIHKGWDLLNSVYTKAGEPEYPTFTDLLEHLPLIIEKSKYSADTKGDYIGALVTRVNSLTNGIYGQIFCDEYDIPDRELFDQNTIIDLSRVGSAETKSLIMGILVLKLTEYRSSKAEQFNERLRHVTILEEAHNILKNTKDAINTAGNSIIGKSVEMICNGIAEMRAYGEGFVIVDQSPTALDISAIKNTNTKIIMRLPEKTDGEIAGHSVSLNESQTNELARLPRGVATVMQNNWLEALLVKLPPCSGRYRGTQTRVDYKTMRKFKSIVIAELINQYILSDDHDVEHVLHVIERFDICYEKRHEMARTARRLCEQMGRSFDSILLGKTLMRIAGCGDMFRTAEMNIRKIENGDYSESSMDTWYAAVDNQLSAYVEIERRQHEKMLQYILHAKSFETTSVDYHRLYKRFFELQ